MDIFGLLGSSKHTGEGLGGEENLYIISGNICPHFQLPRKKGSR
jgi:hypothetical protein